jgi:CysZ protein
MLQAAFKALSQMFSPPFRAALFKSAGLALLLIAFAAVGLFELLSWLGGEGLTRMEGAIGPSAHGPLAALGWIIAIALGLGLFAGAIFLMPAVTSLVAGFFADDIAAEVERTYYPDDPPGVPVPLSYGVIEGIKTALLAVVIYLCCLPFLLIAGLGAVIFFLATAYLLGREYFFIAALRQHPLAAAKALWLTRRWEVFSAGLFIAAFVLIPIVNLATPLFATAFMVHVQKRLSGASGRAIEPRR